MLQQVKTAAICGLCKCGLDTTEPHAIVKHDYAHLACADEHDSRDQGGGDLPPFADETEGCEI